MATSTETIALELIDRNNSSTQHVITSRISSRTGVGAQHNVAPPPEGGYGWVVVFSCSMLTFWFVGTSYSWGVLQKSLVESEVGSASTLSFVGGLTAMCIAVLAVSNARILRAIGARWTGVAGVIILGVGELVSSFFVKSLVGLFIGWGFIGGVGTSLCFMAVSIAPAQYFTRRRGLANGIVYAGGGIGGAVTSLAMEKMVQNVGPAWTMRIIGLLTIATGLPAALLIKERAPVRRKTFIEWDLFKDLKFSLLFVAGAIGTFPLFVPPFFLPLYSQSIGLSAANGAAMLAGFNLASAFGRIGFGIVCDAIGPLHALFISLLLGALSLLAIWPISSELGPLILFVIINGAANGGFFSTMPTVVGSLFESARVNVAMGMVVTGWAGGYLMGAPIAGYILNAFGRKEGGFKAYRPAMYYAGSMSLAAAILVGMLRIRIDSKWKNKI